jgi:DNA repair protein RadA/Sms
MILAVLEKHARIRFGERDVYVATVGGMRLTEPAADLAVALAVASSVSEAELPTGIVAVGEVGLAGELRRVTGVQRRLAEAQRMGFTHALIPPDCGPAPDGMTVKEIPDLPSALQLAFS